MEKRHCWEKIENRERKKKTEYEIRVCEKIERKKSFGYLLIVHFEHWRNVKYKLYPCDVSREDSTHHFISFLLSLLNSRYHWSNTGGGYSILYCFLSFNLAFWIQVISAKEGPNLYHSPCNWLWLSW
jgi:hypothetical protein